jgi:tRNA1Val (adenine37-N6)-methyltransferase
LSTFKFKYFSVEQAKYAHAVGTDAMVLGALVDAPISPKSALDIGTGTGVLALMIAQRFPMATVEGIEKNDLAAQLAQRNFENSPFKQKPLVIHESFQDYASVSTRKFDLILSNPPFFKQATLAPSEVRAMARHQASLTINELREGVEKVIAPNGQFWVILPTDQADDLMRLSTKLKLVRRIRIYGKLEKHIRDVLVFSKSIGSSEPRVVNSELTIRDESGSYTDEYKELTKAFHGVAL